MEDVGRLAWLARRLIWVEAPNLLADHHRAAMAAEKAARMVAKDGECGGWLTLEKAQAELLAVMENMSEEAAEPFRKLGGYYEERRSAAARCVVGNRIDA